MADDVSAPLPELSWPDQAIITVATGDASALITRLVIHFSQDVPEDAVTVEPYTPLFVFGAG